MPSSSRSHEGTGAFVVRVAFDAPLNYVFRWCTDYSPEDPSLEGDASAKRVVLSSSPREVRFEDLVENPAGGWMWSRWVVSLHPPNWWHGDSMGSTRDWSADYRLRSLSPARTELTFRGRRRPARLGGTRLTHRQVQTNLEASWKMLKKALERDFRKSRAPKRASRPSR
jgi:hypothetical protein